MNDNHDYRIPEPDDKQPDDWGDRFQPIRVVRDDDLAPPSHPSHSAPTQINQPPVRATQPIYRPMPRPRRWRRVLATVIVVPLIACALVYAVIPPVDVLVLGVDARPGEGYVTRTDTIMLVGVQPRRMRANLLSIPRDLFINVPGYGSQRINIVNVLGEQQQAGYGPELLSAGIANSFGVQPDRYVRVNFDAFVQLVDAVGGITVNVPRRIVDNAYPTRDYGTISVVFEPGRQRMDGETALMYARTRHADDDYGRAERQQQVITALVRQLANPLNWGVAVVTVKGNMDTDMNLLEMALYAPPVLASGGTGTMNRLVIDRDYILPGAGGAVPDYDKLRPWLVPRFD